jgi:hypothetical protein
LLERLRQVLEAQARHEEVIKTRDCIEFLSVSRPYYYKLCADVAPKGRSKKSGLQASARS